MSMSTRRSPTRAASSPAPSLARLHVGGETSKRATQCGTPLFLALPLHDLLFENVRAAVEDAKSNLLSGDQNALYIFVKSVKSAADMMRGLCQEVNTEFYNQLKPTCSAGAARRLCEAADFMPYDGHLLQDDKLHFRVGEQALSVSWKRHFLKCTEILPGLERSWLDKNSHAYMQGVFGPYPGAEHWSRSIKGLVLAAVVARRECVEFTLRALVFAKPATADYWSRSYVVEALMRALKTTRALCGTVDRSGGYGPWAWLALCKASDFLPADTVYSPHGGSVVQHSGNKSHIWWEHFNWCTLWVRRNCDGAVVQVEERPIAKNIKGLVLMSVAFNYENVEWVSPALRHDEDVWIVAAKYGGSVALKLVPPELVASDQFEDKAVALGADVNLGEPREQVDAAVRAVAYNLVRKHPTGLG